MYRKILIGGATAAVIVGAGGTALALSGTGTTDGSPVAGPASMQQLAALSAARPGHGRLLKRMAHAEVVTRAKDGSFVTHQLIRGTVTAVSPTSITVRAADKTSETFVVDKDTAVRVRTGGKGSPSSIDKVANGDQVLVAGTGTSTVTAKHIVDVKK